MSETLPERWFVLLVQDGGAVTTENPTQELFDTEDEAVAFAKESSKEDKDGGEAAVYYVFKSVCAARAIRSVRVQMVPTKKGRK